MIKRLTAKNGIENQDRSFQFKSVCKAKYSVTRTKLFC